MNKNNKSNNINTNKFSFEDFALIACGHTAFQLLWSGVQLNIFNILFKNPGLDHEQIARELKLQLQPARILLVGLTSLRLIEKVENKYYNSETTNELLVSESPTNMIDVLGWQNYIVYPGLTNFTECLKENKNLGLLNFEGTEDNLYSRLAHTPKLEKVFQNAMSSLSNTANKILVENVDFKNIKHLVDGGGGDATNAITIAKANPHINVTVFDSQSVTQIASENIKSNNLSDRVKTHVGDFFNTPYPENVDAILFCHILTIWSPSKNIELLRVANKNLKKGERVIIFNMMGNDDDTGPISTALGSPYFLSIATGQGMLYSWKDYENFLNEAGFEIESKQKLPKSHGVIIATKK